MKSRTTKSFRASLASLPRQVQQQAKGAFKQFKEDHTYPSLHFKRVHERQPVYSARISLKYRVVGVVDGDEIVWFWAGSHADYEKLLARMRAG
jgi:mRNA-degrading endonuclease RelE of RelBE toxin-antitoxin system